ncbi:alpha/beta-hydrolase [Sarocladium strictum]
MKLNSGLSASLALAITVCARSCGPVPTVDLANGTYYGVYNPNYEQDAFLGIPYAQPPLGDLRFLHPQPLNTTWEGRRNATTYQTSCHNYPYPSGPLIGGKDDCLTLNVIRPAGMSSDAKLPVAIWIHGGGLVSGSNSDPRSNLSFIVEESVKIGQPIIAVSINYRLHAWGFLWSDAVNEEGLGNNGFRDQRLAMAWVQENIPAFGGDPEKVTIWGQSGGARAVASQLTAFSGRDDHLFRAAVLQSGTGFITDFGEVKPPNSVTWEEAYASLLNKTSCEDASDSLQCLREVPSDELAVIFGEVRFPVFLDIVDGDIVQKPRIELLRQGKFVHVPVLTGTTVDDGDYFAQQGVNTTEQWEDYLVSGGAGPATIEALSALYPDIPRLGLPSTYEGRPEGEDAQYGAMWKRAMAFGGDRAMQAPRRAWARLWAEAGLPIYSYRFDQVTGDRPAVLGAGHSAELAFVFGNTKGAGYTNGVGDPFVDAPEEFVMLSKQMMRRWISFFNEMDPNGGVEEGEVEWPVYELGRAENLVFHSNYSGLAVTQPDTHRTEQFEYLNKKLWRVGMETED